MVLFYDDDHRIPKAPLTGWRKYLRRLIKIIVIFSVMLAITMWVLSTAGGNSKALRLGIQDYLTDATGYIAELNILESMEFFPVTHIKFSDLTLHRPVMKEKTAAQIADEEERHQNTNEIPQMKGISDYYDAGEVVARIGAADIRMNFWDMFLSRRRFYALDVQDITIEDGVWLPRRFHLQTLKVDQDGEAPALAAAGLYGDYVLDMRVQIKKMAGGAYEIPDIARFKLRLGDLQAEGNIDTRGRQTTADINNLRMGDHVFKGTVALKENFSNTGLTLALETGRSAIEADLSYGDAHVTGTVTARALDMADIHNAWLAYRELRALWGGEVHDNVSFGALGMDIKLVVEKLVRGAAQTPWGHVKADLVVQPYLWQLKDITGLIDGGALKGSFSIDATGTGDAQLKADMALRGWDYAQSAADNKTAVTGQADIYLRLQSTGKNFAALKESVAGDLIVVGGAGVLSRDTLLYGSGKIMEKMLPAANDNHDLNMNCLLADFNIDGTQATARSLLMDISGLSVSGKGTINLDDMVVDIKLNPAIKDESTSNRSAAVRIKGALPDIVVTGNGAPSPRKDGDLSVTDFNPALFSLHELGLQESHPCRAYIKNH